jgi:hypothetical protein
MRQMLSSHFSATNRSAIGRACSLVNRSICARKLSPQTREDRRRHRQVADAIDADQQDAGDLAPARAARPVTGGGSTGSARGRREGCRRSIDYGAIPSPTVRSSGSPSTSAVVYSRRNTRANPTCSRRGPPFSSGRGAATLNIGWRALCGGETRLIIRGAATGCWEFHG